MEQHDELAAALLGETPAQYARREALRVLRAKIAEHERLDADSAALKQMKIDLWKLVLSNIEVEQYQEPPVPHGMRRFLYVVEDDGQIGFRLE